jgi:uncharacterized protein with HEPN domain
MAATRNPLSRLRHIRDEIESIAVALRGTDHDGFVESYVLRRAAERALLIISEAAKALPRELTDRYPNIDWRGVRALGDVLRHDYERIDADTLWEILIDKLPELATVIRRMLGDLER